jgi:YgiT-type zinc finger domain-containing protein
MRAFDKCPVCGGELTEKTVDKLLQGGSDSAVITVVADVCLRCGERLYSEATVVRFSEIRKLLEQRRTRGFEPVGQFFKVG